MTTPQALNISLLRPVVLHILRAAGYHSARPSVVDTFTALAANYLSKLAQTAVRHAVLNQDDPQLMLHIDLPDVRMALQDFGALLPERPLIDQDYDGLEDLRGVEAFIGWIMGPENKEIQRIALEGVEGARDDYLTVLKKKHGVADEDSRYIGTVLGKPAEPRAVKIEGAEVASVKDWTQKLRTPPPKDTSISIISSRRQSSVLSSLGDESMGSMEF